MSTRARGELEASVLRIMWNAGDPVTAKEIRSRFSKPVPAHTTLLTALDRLEAKGTVVRVGTALRGIRFAPTMSESEYVGRRMSANLDDSADRRAALLRFAGSLTGDDVAYLREALDRADRA
ncbi:BlaI/MecI/CopY family transcriptional regulator [Gordonia crocea]|uniref:Penicillinase repressor n=1 Tax=Gordonia crocea TaxID=589162 RepID=A0A7I9UZG5_9ACTN|nr:BlaI/MecI/CopY family transcriptional regulator [Gordonia crocea]GED98577.1 penicillinase repressor [Gordonia crocea]